MKILLIGNGKMGRELISIAKDQIVQVIESFKYNYIKVNNIDVIIDFSNRENLKYIYEYAKNNKVKVVFGTTGFTKEDLDLIKDLSNYTAVMLDSNYSKGITLLKDIINSNINNIKNYDISLLEKHHKYKKDNISGTLINFEDILKNNNIKYSLNSIRGGTIRGEHEILLLGEEEYIEIKHVALSRKIYALGALEASRWLMCKEKGLFSYSDCKF